ncbi:hypothetical protein Dda_1085 [Drechslerella dactyloides]|uniref:Uncharacterized protein n=1 Tax=Drechslerella dactyloides TaxID=74499 RepID=A0AAD6J6P3_DREDA|nr:hypothetical protein Dda_1085 [Drechslerella dactyloides]
MRRSALLHVITLISACCSVQVSGSRLDARNGIIVKITAPFALTPTPTTAPPTAVPTSDTPFQVYENVDALELYPQNHEEEGNSTRGREQLQKFADFQFVIGSLAVYTPDEKKQYCTTRYYHASNGVKPSDAAPDSKQYSRASVLCFWKYSVDLWNRRQETDAERDIRLGCDEVMSIAWNSLEAVQNRKSVLRKDFAADEQRFLTSSYWSEGKSWGVDITYWDDGCFNKTAPVDRTDMKAGK